MNRKAGRAIAAVVFASLASCMTFGAAASEGETGTYVESRDSAYLHQKILIYNDTDRDSGAAEAAKGFFLYIEEVKEVQGEEWGRTDYFGVKGWVPLKDLTWLSEEDYSIQPYEECFICTSYEPGIALRAEPTENADLILRMPHGTELNFAEFVNGWGKTSYNGTEAWVKMNYVAIYREECDYMVDTSADYGMHLREAPSVSSENKGYVQNGTVVHLEEVTEGWGRLKYKEKEYWVNMECLIPVPAEN